MGEVLRTSPSVLFYEKLTVGFTELSLTRSYSGFLFYFKLFPAGASSPFFMILRLPELVAVRNYDKYLLFSNV